MTSSKTNCLPKSLPLNVITLGVKASAQEFQEDTNTQDNHYYNWEVCGIKGVTLVCLFIPSVG